MGLKGGATLDDHSVAVVFDILRGLLVSSPDAFLVQKIELPTMDELRDRYPRMQIPQSFAGGVEYVKGRWNPEIYGSTRGDLAETPPEAIFSIAPLPAETAAKPKGTWPHVKC